MCLIHLDRCDAHIDVDYSGVDGTGPWYAVGFFADALVATGLLQLFNSPGRVGVDTKHTPDVDSRARGRASA